MIEDGRQLNYQLPKMERHIVDEDINIVGHRI